MAIAVENHRLLNDVMPVLCHGENKQPEMWQLDAIRELIDAAHRKGRPLVKLLQGDSRRQTVALLAQANKLAVTDTADEAKRMAAIRLLGNVPSALQDDLGTLLGLLTPQTATNLQIAAVDTSIRAGDDAIVQQLVRRWQSFTPAIRSRLLDAFTATDWVGPLLTAIEGGQIPSNQIDALRRQQLLSHANTDVQARAAKLFATSNDRNLEAIIDQYHEVLVGDPNLSAGKELFVKHCATCHRLADTGHAVGPDLSALTDKSSHSLVTAILDPNRAVEDKYRAYSVVTTDGRQLVGLLAQETGTALNLIAADARQHAILRSDIEELVATGKSLMPDGLHRDISPPQMADIVAYVRSVAPPPKSFPGNVPQIAPVRDDGSIRLFAMHAKIYGPSLIFEPQYRNLGFWSSDADHAIWTLNVPRAGKYSVSLDYACDHSTAGNRFRISAAGKTVTGTVLGTGAWDDYSGRKVGILDLPAGNVEVVFRSDGPVNQFLIDLRTVILYPRSQ